MILPKNNVLLTIAKVIAINNKTRSKVPTLDMVPSAFFTACGYFRPSDSAVLTKVPITVVSEANDHSRIAAHTCVSKVIEYVEERMPIANPLRRFFVWSDGCASQFRSRYVFALLNHLHPDKNVKWNYNEAHHGKGPLDGIGGTIKNQVFREV